MKSLFTFITALLLAIPVGLSAQNQVLILNKSSNTAWQLNAENGQKIAEYKTGTGPHEVAVSPDQSRAIITNYSSDTPGNSLTIVDLKNQQVSKRISLGEYQRPHGVKWFSDERRAIVTTEAQQSVLIVDIDSGEILKSIKTGQQVSHMVVLGADEQTAYVTNLGSGSVSILDLEDGKTTQSIKTGDGTEGITTVPGRDEIWITNRSANTVNILDISSNEITETLESSSFPIRAKVSADGNRIAVSNAQSSEVAIFDVETRKQIQKVSTVSSNQEGTPIGLTFSHDGNYLFVANSTLNEIAVIDTGSWKVVKNFATGTTPDGIAYINMN